MNLFKKVLLLSALTIATASAVASAEVIEFTIGEAEYAFEKDDKIEQATLEAAPFINEVGRTMVPVRVISDTFGADTDWNKDTREVTVSGADKKIVLKIDSTDAVVDGAEVALDSAPVIVGGRTFVPLRFVSETLLYNVNYVKTTKNVVIDNTPIVVKCGEEKVSLAEAKALYNIFYNSSHDDAINNGLTEDVLKEYLLNAVIETASQIARVTNAFPSMNLTEDDCKEILAGIESEKETVNMKGLNALISERYYYSLGISAITDILNSGKAAEAYQTEYISAKHILVEDEKLAKDICKKLADGADFDELVKEHNTDPGMEQNPDGYVFTKGDMVIEFETAAYELEVGKVSEPVKTNYGYHIIKRVELPELTKNQELEVAEAMANKQLSESLKAEVVMDSEELKALIK